MNSYYKSKLDDMIVHDDIQNNRIRVSEKIVKQSDGFVVDSTPNFENLSEPIVASTPAYRKSFGRTVLTGEKEAADRGSITSTPRNACFNCDKATHSLRDCPEPRNMKKVNKARSQFNRKDLRYHDDSENEFGHMIPGQISDDLREALGLSATQIPLHVYRMRLFGYPPGWIEEAKIHNSGLSMFVEHDKKQLHSEEDVGGLDNNNFKYDVQKIFGFPGFNVQPEHKFVDQHRTYNTPPMMPQHSKEVMIRSLGDDIVNGYKKTKRQSGILVDLTNDSCSVEKTASTAADMEIEDVDEETLPPGVTVYTDQALGDSSTKPHEPMEDGELSNESRSRSPSESELIEQRKVLLAEIGGTSAINPPVNAPNQSSFSRSHLEATIIENSENENRDNIAKDTAAIGDDERKGHVDITIFGCPLLPSFSSYQNLPAGENFQEGVSDVIAFENLSESTGKYEKMKKLIKKVRDFQCEHQKE